MRVALLPPQGPIRQYSLITLASAIGFGAYVTGSAAFFILHVGLTASQVGVGLTVAGILGLSASVPAGVLGDRLGHRRLLVWVNVVRAAAFLLYTQVEHVWQFVALAVLVALVDCAEPPNRRAYLSSISTPDERVAANAYNRSVFNVGFAVGAALAGMILAIERTELFGVFVIVNGAASAVAALVLLTLPAAVVVRAAGGHAVAHRALTNWRFMAVALVAGVVYLHQPLLSVGLPLWVLQGTAAPTWVLAPLMLLNTALVITLQVRLSRGTKTAASSARVMARSGWVLAAGCAAWAITGNLPAVWCVVLLAVGMVLVTLGEILCSAASWGVSYALAPEHKQGEYLGAWGLGVQGVQTVGPVLFAAPLLEFGWAAWLVVGAVFVLAGHVTPVLARVAGGSLDAPDAPDAPEAREARASTA